MKRTPVHASLCFLDGDGGGGGGGGGAGPSPRLRLVASFPGFPPALPPGPALPPFAGALDVGRGRDRRRDRVGRADHHADGLEGGVHVDGVPLDAVALEVVLVEALVVVLAVQVAVEAVVEPPGAVEVFGAAVVVAAVVIAVLGAGWEREGEGRFSWG